MPDEYYIYVKGKDGREFHSTADSEEKIVSSWGDLRKEFGEDCEIAVGRNSIDKYDDSTLDPDKEYKIHGTDKNGVAYDLSGRGKDIVSSRGEMDEYFGQDGWFIEPEYRQMTPRYNDEGALEGFDPWRQPTRTEQWDKDYGKEYGDLESRRDDPNHGDQFRRFSTEQGNLTDEEWDRYRSMAAERERRQGLDRLEERSKGKDADWDAFADFNEKNGARLRELQDIERRYRKHPDEYRSAYEGIEEELGGLSREYERLSRAAKKSEKFTSSLDLQKAEFDDFEKTLDYTRDGILNVRESYTPTGTGTAIRRTDVSFRDGADREGYSDDAREVLHHINMAKSFDLDTQLTLNADSDSFFSGAGTVAKDPNTYLANIPEAVRNIQFRKLVDKMMEGGGYDSLTKDEQLVVDAWQRNAEAHALLDPMRSSWFKGGQGAAQSIEFMVEMALTGGIIDAASKGVLKAALEKGLIRGGKELAGKTMLEGLSGLATKGLTGEAKYLAGQGVRFAGGLVKGTVQAALNVPMQLRTFGDELLTFDENGNLPTWGEARKSALFQTWAETYTENGVEPIWNVLTHYPMKWAGLAMRSFLPGAYRGLAEMYTKARVSGLGRMMRAGGFQGLNEEVFEELMNAVIYEAGGEKGAVRDFFTRDNLETLYISFAPITLIGGGASMAQVGMAQRNYNNQRTGFEKMLGEYGFDKNQTALALDNILSDPVEGHRGLLRSIYEQAALEGCVDKDGNLTGRWGALGNKMLEFRAAAAQKAIYDGAWESEQNAQMREEYTRIFNAQGGDFLYRDSYTDNGQEGTSFSAEERAIQEGAEMADEVREVEEDTTSAPETRKERRERRRAERKARREQGLGDDISAEERTQRTIDNGRVCVVETTDGRTVYVLGRAENGEWAVMPVGGGAMTYIGDDQIVKGDRTDEKGDAVRDADGNVQKMTAEETVRAGTQSLKEYLSSRLLLTRRQRENAVANNLKGQARRARSEDIQRMMGRFYKDGLWGGAFGQDGEYRVADAQNDTGTGLFVYKPGQERPEMMTWDEIYGVLTGGEGTLASERQVDEMMEERRKAEQGELPTEQERTEAERSVSALESLPKDKDGNPVFERAESPAQALDALTEAVGDGEQAANMAVTEAADATRAAEAAAKKADKAAKAAQEAKTNPKGKTINEKIANLNKAKAAEESTAKEAEEAARRAEFWQGVAREAAERRNAGQARTENTQQQTETPQAQSESRQEERKEERDRREFNALVDAARELLEKLNVPYRMITSREELLAMAEADGSEFYGQIRAMLDRGTAINAFVRKGEVWFYAPQIFDDYKGDARMAKARQTIAHEVIAHIGLKNLKNAQKEGGFAAFCRDVYGKVMTARDRERYLAYHWNVNLSDAEKRRMLGLDGNAEAPRWESLTAEQRAGLFSSEYGGSIVTGAADEYIASIAEKIERGEAVSSEERTAWQRFMDWLSRLFGAEMTERDVVDALLETRRSMEGGQAESARAEGNAFSAEERRGQDERVLSGVRGQKQPGVSYDTTDIDMDDLGDTRFSVGERRRTEMDNRLKKVRPDLTEEQRDALFDYLGTLTKPNGDNDTKLQNATFNWFAKGAIRIPEDMDKVRQAVKVAERFGVDTSKYGTPMELIDAFSEKTGTENPIDPDTVPTLSNKVDYGNGITVYDVDESEESRQQMRKIIDTHLGKDRNPWCLLARDHDTGELHEKTKGLWYYNYNKYPKRVAFTDGKLTGFFASNGEPTWWDTQDKPYRGIPITRKMDDGSGRKATYEYNEETGEMSGPKDIQKNGTYEEWYDNGQRRSRETYKNGYLVGTAEKWYANGNLQERQTYKNGVLDGYYAMWQRDGTIKFVTQYKEGNKNGIFVQFNNKGNVNYYEEEKNNRAAGLTIAEDSYNTNGPFIAWENDKYGNKVREFSSEEAERLYAEKTAEVNAMLSEMGIPTNGGETKFSAEERNGGRRLDVTEAESLISQMEENAETAPVLELTPENWEKEFGRDNTVTTPLGTVKMGENQYAKLVEKGRAEYFGMIRPTLERPDVILEKNAPKENAERNTKYLFVKTFVKPDGGRVVHFESVTVRKEGMEVSISNHESYRNIVKKEMQNDKILHINEKLSLGSEWSLTETPAEERPDLVPTSDNPSEGKGSENSVTSKENGENPQFSAEERESMTPKQIDDEYFRAMEAGDGARMREMLDEAARRKGYGKDNSWRYYHGAPEKTDYTTDEDGSLYSWTLKDEAEDNPLRANHISDSYYASADINGSRDESMRAIQDALSAIRRGEDPTVTIYRAVPKGVREGKVRRGDWVTMSRAYAVNHGQHVLGIGNYRIIEEKVPASQLYWDGNDINEWGFDDQRDYRYRNTKNNRKLDDLVTRDDDGNVIPPSRRFDSGNADTRFSAGERNIIDKARKEGKLGLAPNGRQSNLYNKYGERVWAMVRTPQFKDWFGDWEKADGDSSKVVDENGEPLVVYHGSRTGGEFNTFDGTAFFTDNKDIADMFRDEAPYFVSVNGKERNTRFGSDVRNIVGSLFRGDYEADELTGNGTMDIKEEWDSLKDYEKEYIRDWLGMDGDEDLETLRIETAQPTFETFLNIRDPYVIDFNDQNWQADENRPEASFEKAREEGHDGMIIRNIVEGGLAAELLNGEEVPSATDYVTFNSNQIKSVDNNGDFSTENDDIRFSAEERTDNATDDLERINGKFNKELKTLTEENANSARLYLGKPSPILRSAGIADKTMLLYGNKVMKKIREHGFAIDDLRDLPLAVANPIAVFRGSEEGTHAVLTELKVNDMNILVSISVGKNNDVDFNIITSAYGKAGRGVINWILNEKLLYTNKEKTLEYLRISAPIAEAQSIEELDSATKVIQDFDNPTLPDENVNFSAEERELSDADTREAVSDIENPENDDRFSAEERVATADEARERLGVELTPEELASTSTRHGAMMIALRKATEDGAIPGMDSDAVLSFLSDTFRDAPEEIKSGIWEVFSESANPDIAGEVERSLADYVSREVRGAELTDAQKEFLGNAARTIAGRLGISEDNAKYVLWQHANAGNDSVTDEERQAMRNALGVSTPASDYEAGVQSELRFSAAREDSNDSAAEMYSRAMGRVAGALNEVGFNEYRAIDSLVEAVSKQTGREYTGWDPRKAFNQLTSNVKARIEAYLRDYFDPMSRTIDGISRKRNISKDKLAEYAALKHGLERNRVLHERDTREAEEKKRKAPERRDYSGLGEWMREYGEYATLDELEAAAQAKVDEYEEILGDSAGELWDAVRAATAETLRIQLRNGLITRETYDRISSMFGYYVPLQGFAEDTNEDKYEYMGGFHDGSTGTIGKRAKGRKSRAANPFARIGLNAEKTIMEAEKNRAKQALYYFLRANSDNDLTSFGTVWYVKTGRKEGDKDVWEVSAPALTGGETAEELRSKIGAWEEEMRKLEGQGLAKRERDRLDLGDDVVFTYPQDVSEHSIDVLVDGYRERIYVNGDPRAAQAANGLLRTKNTAFERFLKRASRYTSTIYTSGNPQFFVTNFARDIGFATFNVYSKEGMGYLTRFLGNALRCAQIGLLSRKFRNGNADADRRMQRLYGLFAMNGGITGYSQVRGEDYFEKEIEKSLGAGHWLWKALTAIPETFRTITENGENLLRFAAFLTSYRDGRGKSLTDSIADAKDVTVNFNRRGTGRAIGAREAERLIPGDGVREKAARLALQAASGLLSVGPAYSFFNVSMQGMSQLFKNMRQYPQRSVPVLVCYAGLGLLNGIIHGCLNAAMGGDAPDPDDPFYNIPDWERRTNFIIQLPGGNYIKIPISQELRPFYALGDMIGARLAHKTAQKDLPVELLSLFGEMLPINPLGEGGLGQSLAPTIASPAVDLMVNRDYRGLNIIPERYGGAKATWLYSYGATPDWAVAASRALNGVLPMLSMTDIDRKRMFEREGFWKGMEKGLYSWNRGDSGVLDVSPEAVQHLAEGYAGGLLTFVSMCYETAESAANGEEANMRRVPYVNRFYGRPQDRQTGSYLLEMNRYAQKLDKRSSAKMDRYLKNMDTDEAVEFSKTAEFYISALYSGFKDNLKKINEAMASTDDEQAKMTLIDAKNGMLTMLAEWMEEKLYDSSVRRSYSELSSVGHRYDGEVERLTKQTNQ